METKVLQPAHEMTTAQCVMECSGYLRTIANQDFEGEDWQTATKLRRRNLLTDFLCNIELSGKEFAELCGLIGFQLSKATTAKLAKFTVIAYDWQSEANGEATADILAALDKCAGVTLIEEHGYRPQARTYDYLRFHIAAFWRCLVNELRSLCLGIGLVVRPKEIPATPTETPQFSTETAETVNVSAEGEKEAERAENKPKAERMKSKDDITEQLERIRVTFLSLPDWDLEPRVGRMMLAEDICKRYLENINQHLGLYDETEFCRYSDLKIPQLVYAAPQSPETPQAVECTADTPKPRETAEKRQNRAIGCMRTTRHDTLRNTLRPVTYVPRECSTVDVSYW